MRLEPMTEAEIDQTEDWTPQAILTRDITAALVPGFAFRDGEDGLDAYEGVFGYADGRPVAIKRHRGHPVDRITIFLPRTIEDLDVIDAEIRFVLGVIGLDETALYWERRHWADDATVVQRLAARLVDGVAR